MISRLFGQVGTRPIRNSTRDRSARNLAEHRAFDCCAAECYELINYCNPALMPFILLLAAINSVAERAG